MSFSNIVHGQPNLITRMSHNGPSQTNISPMKDTSLAACSAISSHPIFSRRITSGSEDLTVLGNIGVPNVSKPKILSMPCHDHKLAYGRLWNTPPFQHWMFGLSLARAYVETNQHGLFPFHHQASLIAESV